MKRSAEVVWTYSNDGPIPLVKARVSDLFGATVALVESHRELSLTPEQARTLAVTLMSAADTVEDAKGKAIAFSSIGVRAEGMAALGEMHSEQTVWRHTRDRLPDLDPHKQIKISAAIEELQALQKDRGDLVLLYKCAPLAIQPEPEKTDERPESDQSNNREG